MGKSKDKKSKDKKSQGKKGNTTTVDLSGKIVATPVEKSRKIKVEKTVGVEDLDFRKMCLAGTISIPPSLSQKATVTVESKGELGQQILLLKATQEMSQRVSVTRTFFSKDVKAIFVPTAGRACDLKTGQWYLGTVEVAAFVVKQRQFAGFEGVLFVAENAQSLLETKAGLTASENAEYYPPLPQDCSGGHYNLKKVGCGQDECCDFPEEVCCDQNDGGGGDCC